MWRAFSKRQYGIVRIAGICGILLPFVIFTCLGLSIAVSPWFTWTQHALSDLGIQQSTAILFNNGIILSGLLTLIFSVGLIKILSRKIGAYLLLFSSLALIGIGLFPETVFPLHFFSSASFFVLLTIAFAILGFTIKQNSFERNIGSLALVLALIAMGSAVFLFSLQGIAIVEALACFPAFIWCLIVGVKMTLI
jgi:hypothetical membrane protein